MNVFKVVAGFFAAASVLGFIIAVIAIINLVLLKAMPTFLLIETIVAVNCFLMGIISITVLKIMNDTEEHEENTKEQLKLLKEMESQARVEQNSL